MKTKIILSLIVLSIGILPVFAEKIPVKIKPAQTISTNHDEIEVGDKLKFTTVNDVYVDDKIYIKAGTNVYGVVDFLHNNGWTGDYAEIKLNEFITQNINGEKIVLKYPIDIKGSNKTNCKIKTFLLDISLLIRGAEINIEPNSTYINIFINH